MYMKKGIYLILYYVHPFFSIYGGERYTFILMQRTPFIPSDLGFSLSGIDPTPIYNLDSIGHFGVCRDPAPHQKAAECAGIPGYRGLPRLCYTGPSMADRPKTRHYPWDIWLNGERHTITRGVDFHCALDSMRQMLYRKAPGNIEVLTHGQSLIFHTKKPVTTAVTPTD